MQLSFLFLLALFKKLITCYKSRLLLVVIKILQPSSYVILSSDQVISLVQPITISWNTSQAKKCA